MNRPPNKRRTTLIAAAVAVAGALAAPAADGRPLPEQPIDASSPALEAPATPPSATTPADAPDRVIVRSVEDDSFDWGAALVGGGVATGALVLVVGAVAAGRNARNREVTA